MQLWTYILLDFEQEGHLEEGVNKGSRGDKYMNCREKRKTLKFACIATLRANGFWCRRSESNRYAFKGRRILSFTVSLELSGI